jgi:SAM-dependent methyltransferase
VAANARHTGAGPAEVTAALRAGYDAAAPGWTQGPGRVYARLAQALVAAAPVPLPGARVLDLGAGTGLAGQAALTAGARQVVAADLSLTMLRQARNQSPPPPGPPAPGGAAWSAVVADAVALPFGDGSFGLVLAAFCLNHLDNLAAGLAELRRVGTAIAASTFAPGWSHPALDAVEEVLRSAGYQPPAWHASLCPGERASDPTVLAEQASAAGYTNVSTCTIDVRTDLATSTELMSWRLGLAQVAPFLSALDPLSRASLQHQVEQAVTAAVSGTKGVDGTEGTAPLVVSMLILTAS